jgi:hypothetical protein
MSQINDIATRAEGNYYEYIIVKGNETRNVEDRVALWQALVGEIKTRPGEVQGEGLTNYGCDIYKILGQPVDTLIVKDVEYYINALAPKYSEIRSLSVDTFLEYRNGRIKITILVDSIFGRFKESVTIGGPC